MKVFFFTLFLAGFAMEHIVVWSEYTCDGRDLLSLFNQLLTLKREFNDYKLNNEKTTANLNAFILEQNKILANLTRELQVLKDISGIAFIARITDVHSICTDPLIFGTIVANKGGAFNATTGYFTAPYTGFYFLSVQLCSHEDSSFDFGIRSLTTNNTYAASRNGKTTDHTCTSVATAAQLISGEQVYVHVECPGVGTIEGHINDRFWTMFTGTILHY